MCDLLAQRVKKMLVGSHDYWWPQIASNSQIGLVGWWIVRPLRNNKTMATTMISNCKDAAWLLYEMPAACRYMIQQYQNLIIFGASCVPAASLMPSLLLWTEANLREPLMANTDWSLPSQQCCLRSGCSMRGWTSCIAILEAPHRFWATCWRLLSIDALWEPISDVLTTTCSPVPKRAHSTTSAQSDASDSTQLRG